MNIYLNTVAVESITKGGITKFALIHDFDLNNIVPSTSNDVLIGMADRFTISTIFGCNLYYTLIKEVD